MAEIKENLISVITVCYNAENNLERTILSVLNQTYSNIEYIIIDGGSTDGTIDLIKKYADKITYWQSETDKGIYDAMNKGIQKATGEWINFMNAGDLFSSTTILQQMSDAIKPRTRILRGNIIRIYPKFKVKSVGVTTQEPDLMDMFDNTFHHQACLIQNSLFREFGLYSTDYRLCSDWKFFFDCVVLHNVKSQYVDLTVAHFKMDGTSSNNSILYKKEQESYLKNIYGEEQFNLLHELKVYRKLKIITLYYKGFCYMMGHLSQQNFSRLLMIKRFVRRILGISVN
jgi:glycosyltransferase involved in cell wall biosynthesis